MEAGLPGMWYNSGVIRHTRRFPMSQMQIARVDAIPLLFAWMQRMDSADQIDAHWITHRVWAGLSCGQLTVLFLIVLIHERDHRLSALEPWVLAHHATLTAVTGWTIRREDVTDDRLGHLLGVIGKSPAQMTVLQQALGRHLVRAYALPTTIARVDTTSFNVTHAPSPDGQSERALLQFGYSKDQRPDLLQCKQTLTTLDPGGVPLLSTTLPGNHADAPCYLPAWRELVALLGHASCLFVADSKAAALETRATMAAGAGRYLFPVPMTGAVPALLRGWVAQPPVTPEPIVLPPTLDDPDEPRTVGAGFVVTRTMTGTTDTGEAVTWEERWLVVQSTAYAERQQAAFDAKLERVATQLQRLRPVAQERAADVQARVDALLKREQVADYFTVTVTETATVRRKSGTRGRPSASTPVVEEPSYTVQVTVARNAEAIAEARTMLGWRCSVSNTPTEELSLVEAMGIYCEEWTVERNYHRWKRGGLPALPLYVQLEWRIRGLMLLLLLGLQVLTLLEWEARRSLAEAQETIAGLAPGNPKRATARPTAERMLSVFTNIHLQLQRVGDQWIGTVVETLTPVQQRIVQLLKLSPTLYTFQATIPAELPTPSG
jgi:transposase